MILPILHIIIFVSWYYVFSDALFVSSTPEFPFRESGVKCIDIVAAMRTVTPFPLYSRTGLMKPWYVWRHHPKHTTCQWEDVVQISWGASSVWYQLISYILHCLIFIKQNKTPKTIFDMSTTMTYRPLKSYCTYRRWLNLHFSQVQVSLQVVPTALRGTNPAVAPTVTPGASPAMAFGSAMLGEPGWYGPEVQEPNMVNPENSVNGDSGFGNHHFRIPY